MALLLKGAPVSAALNAKTAEMAESLLHRGVQPALAIVRVGERPDDLSYERMAVRRAQAAGVHARCVALDAGTDTEALLAVIAQLNDDPSIHGILLLDQKLIRGTFENGTEYTVIATALNLPKDLLRKIQKFDFTKKNPKLIYINTTEKMISLEDSILTAFLSLVGFDVLFFVPTGYQCIEQHFARPFAGETQIGDYLYDLRIPDFNTVQESGLHSIRKLFGRSS